MNRYVTIGAACLALLGLLLSASVATRPGIKATTPQNDEVSRPAAGGSRVFARPEAPRMHASISTAAHQAASAMEAPPLRPFAFLGRITEGDKSLVLLHRAGRTLKVLGAGPVTDDYEVDALLDDLLVLHHVPTGTRQLIELVLRNTAEGPPATPDDTPQD